MATSGNERRMVFDIRGRRKHVVKVVYAILALLMGASLFLVVGPVNIGEIFGGGESSNGSSAFVEQAEKTERQLRKDPENPDLLASLTKARINAGNAMATIDPETGSTGFTSEGRQQLLLASEAWSKYLKAADEPKAGPAQAAAPMLFTLAQISTNGTEAEANIRDAATAQKIVAVQRPSLGSLSTLGIYQLYSFQYPEGRQSQKEAEKRATTKFERENLGNQFDQIEKRAHEFEKQLAKLEKEAKQARGKGESALPNPLSESNPLAAP